MPSEFDFVVIGAGMAGASIAAELSRNARVAIVERESQPGYHTTGRSAALYSEIYGSATIRALTRASRQFLFNPPAAFCAHPLVSPRGTLFFARHTETHLLDEFAQSIAAEHRPVRIDGQHATKLVPIFRPGYLGGGMYEDGSADIDVAALLQGYLVQARRNGASVLLDCRISSISKVAGKWIVRPQSDELTAEVLVNAAGAWGDEVARMAGVTPIGLVPKRRTAALIEVPEGFSAASWPAAVHITESFYFKPDAGLLLLSPADETPSEPVDVQAEELDVAVAVDRFEEATGRQIRRLRSCWAGLRTFVADKTPVVGFDVDAGGFFWFVGQGGYGIQTAPGMARTGASLARREPIGDDLVAQGVNEGSLSPTRSELRRA